jgi:hypothetical protein
MADQTKPCQEPEKRSIVNALDGIRDMIASFAGGIEFPQLANGPVEEVLAFNNNEFIVLKDPTGNPYFSSHGPLTDLNHKIIPGTRVATTFPIDPTSLDESFQWPPVQVAPFDQPPVNKLHSTNQGYSKQAYFFDSDATSLITVGPSTPKIAPLKNGGAQFWVCSGAMVTQATGRYEGVRGASVYLGSGYLPVWSDKIDEQIKILAAGFVALVTTYFKLVPKSQRAN